MHDARAFQEKTTKLRNEKEEEEEIEVPADGNVSSTTTTNLLDENEKEKEIESIRALFTQKQFFDESRNCLANVISHKKNRFALIDIDETNVHHHQALINQSKMFNNSGRSMNCGKREEMAPPQLSTTILTMHSRRRRRNPMQILDEVTSNKNRIDMMNSTKINHYAGAIPKVAQSTPRHFSSTMLAPDFAVHGNLDFSSISNISTISHHRSHANSSEKNYQVLSSINVQHLYNHQQQQQQQDLTVKKIEEIQCEIEIESQLKKGQSLVSLEEAFSNELTIKTESIEFEVPKIKVNDETDTLSGSTSITNTREESTLCDKENFTLNSSSSVEKTMIFKNTDEENLFNVSDTLLVDD
jgi:hypothetical protein